MTHRFYVTKLSSHSNLALEAVPCAFGVIVITKAQSVSVLSGEFKISAH